MSISSRPTPATGFTDFKVADLSLAEFGRKEIMLAEHEMPGLMALRAEFGSVQPWCAHSSAPTCPPPRW